MVSGHSHTLDMTIHEHSIRDSTWVDAHRQRCHVDCSCTGRSAWGMCSMNTSSFCCNLGMTAIPHIGVAVICRMVRWSYMLPEAVHKRCVVLISPREAQKIYFAFIFQLSGWALVAPLCLALQVPDVQGLQARDHHVLLSCSNFAH